MTDPPSASFDPAAMGFPWVNSLRRMLRASRPAPLDGSTIYIVSDYGGEHAGAVYATYSFLAVEMDQAWLWETRRTHVRSLHLRDKRRISFKGLRDRRQRHALVPFLRAADHLNGVLLTVAIRKAWEFDPFDCAATVEALASSGKPDLRSWAGENLRKMVCISHLFAVVVAELTVSSQAIYWMSDQDSTQANPTKQADTIAVVNVCLKLNGVGQPSVLGIGTTAIDPGDRMEEDLAAITDLSAGAVGDAFETLSAACGGRIPSRVAVQLNQPLQPKTDVIWDWLTDSTGQLTKVVILMEPEPGARRYTVARFVP